MKKKLEMMEMLQKSAAVVMGKHEIDEDEQSEGNRGGL